jgi:prevent-host-death family protein
MAIQQKEQSLPSPTIPIESLKFTEARPKLSSLLDRVFRRETRVRLYKGSVPVAAIVSIGDLEQLEQLDRQREADFDEIFGIGKYFLDVSDDELQEQIDKAVAEVRAEMRAERLAASRT